MSDVDTVSAQGWSHDSGVDACREVTKIVNWKVVGDKNGRRFPDF